MVFLGDFEALFGLLLLNPLSFWSLIGGLFWDVIFREGYIFGGMFSHWGCFHFRDVFSPFTLGLIFGAHIWAHICCCFHSRDVFYFTLGMFLRDVFTLGMFSLWGSRTDPCGTAPTGGPTPAVPSQPPMPGPPIGAPAPQCV